MEPPEAAHYYETFLSLLNRDLFGGFLDLILLGKEELQDTVLILGLDSTTVDPVIQVKAAFKALERKFFADGLVIFCLGFFFLFEADHQLTVVDGKLEIFLGAAGGGELQVVSIGGLMDVYRRKSKAFVAAQTSGETLKEFIYEVREAPVAVVVYFYECHIQSFLLFLMSFDAGEGSNDIPADRMALFHANLARLTGFEVTQLRVCFGFGDIFAEAGRPPRAVVWTTANPELFN
jgi:hypothetical protein